MSEGFYQTEHLDHLDLSHLNPQIYSDNVFYVNLAITCLKRYLRRHFRRYTPWYLLYDNIRVFLLTMTPSVFNVASQEYYYTTLLHEINRKWACQYFGSATPSLHRSTRTEYGRVPSNNDQQAMAFMFDLEIHEQLWLGEDQGRTEAGTFCERFRVIYPYAQTLKRRDPRDLDRIFVFGSGGAPNFNPSSGLPRDRLALRPPGTHITMVQAFLDQQSDVPANDRQAGNGLSGGGRSREIATTANPMPEYSALINRTQYYADYNVYSLSNHSIHSGYGTHSEPRHGVLSDSRSEAMDSSPGVFIGYYVLVDYVPATPYISLRRNGQGDQEQSPAGVQERYVRGSPYTFSEAESARATLRRSPIPRRNRRLDPDIVRRVHEAIILRRFEQALLLIPSTEEE